MPTSTSTSPATAAGGWSTFLSLAGGRRARYPSDVEPMAPVHSRSYRYAHRPGGYQLASLHAVTPEGQERGTMRRMEIRMELTEALVTEDITPIRTGTTA